MTDQTQNPHDDTHTPENDPLAPEPVPEQGDGMAAEQAAYTDAAGADRAAVLETELARLKDHLLRALADADNTRKRATKEREDATKFAVTGFARDLLEVADNFRRALDSIPAETKEGDPLIANLMEGIEAIERSLLKTFEKHGIRKIEPLGEAFDPHFHEVMFEAPLPGKPAGTIIQVLEPGYVLNDRLLRPARVGIAKDSGAESGGPAHTIDQSV